jgi:hypothetical protein
MHRTCGIHQPNFLPWPGYFYKIANVDEFVFLDNVDIEIGGSKAITHRTKINSQNGASWLSNPIQKSQSKIISELTYVHSDWKEKNLKTIFLNYKKAPYFNEVFPLVEKIFTFESNNLSDFNINSISVICNYLGIKTNFSKASELNLIDTDRNGRIIEICKSRNCEVYFSGKGAVNYHDESLFEAHGVTIKYTDFSPKTYIQIHGEFVPGLSIIDLLFNENDFRIKNK